MIIDFFPVGFISRSVGIGTIHIHPPYGGCLNSDYTIEFVFPEREIHEYPACSGVSPRKQSPNINDPEVVEHLQNAKQLPTYYMRRCKYDMTLASNISAYWILSANTWMQHPVGYVIRNGRAELTDFFAVVAQKPAMMAFIHTVSASYILAGFFVMGVSAYHLLKKQNTAFFSKSFRVAMTKKGLRNHIVSLCFY